MSAILAGDIGGTKTLLALYRLGPVGELELQRSERYISADWSGLEPMVRTFLGGEAAPPAAACLAVAGPVAGGRAQLTNLSWQLDEVRLQLDTAIPRVELVNDFAVLIHGLAHLAPHQQAPIRAGTAQVQAPLLVLGAGTGLGVAYGVPSPAGLVAMASEAAHGEFAPRSQAEWELKQWLGRELGLERVSIERVVSGTGLGDLARWLLHCHHPSGDHPLCHLPQPSDLPAAVASAASRGDRLAAEALGLWISCYGSVCGDLALAGLSHGGIWLAGGTAAKLLDQLRSAGFLAAFLAKGRLAPVLAQMPITAVIDPEIGQFSAACRARMLVA
jgi:glucokinase